MHRLNGLFFFGIFLFSFLAMAACEKESTAPAASTAAALVGRWELTHTTGGLTGHVLTADPNRKREIIFTADGQAELIVNGIITGISPYTLTQALSRTTRQSRPYLAYGPDGPDTQQYIEQISPTSLILAQDFEDGISSYFIRR
ncbi:hypothetical protein [Hymenobacter terricola]|uniref:hypothetical protein n=1 Tax=Hymenobacter terricola TaxID=2819236 RepID=UPI001B307FA6|nr:hypothetical protein [Hymenobacter terricola]